MSGAVEAQAVPQLAYAFEPLPPGRVGFRRWRWQLWRGGRLLASGWRTTPRDAERAICAAASRSVHEWLGLHVLRPHAARPLGAFLPGAPLDVDCGSFTCRVLPRVGDAVAA